MTYEYNIGIIRTHSGMMFTPNNSTIALPPLTPRPSPYPHLT
jgi:hypothetical protein